MLFRYFFVLKINGVFLPAMDVWSYESIGGRAILFCTRTIQPTQSQATHGMADSCYLVLARVILSRPSFCRMSQLRTKQKQQPPTCGMDKTTMVWSGDDNGCVSNLVE
jgi:hypothetical protein